jgi:hypothetical protein
MASTSTYLSKTFSTGDNRKKWTWSAWIKRSNLGSDNWLFHAWVNSSNENSIFFDSSDRLAFSIYEGATNNNGRLTTTRKFRDTSAWYHIQCVWDSANATATDRMIIYVNGERETSFDTQINATLNYDSLINSNNAHYIGQYGDGTSSMRFSGCMSHVHFIDGTAYDASAFGQYDANGVWTIKNSPSVTYGTNGFFILKNGNSVTDQSGNSNNFTVAGGTLTNTEDNPSNVFATLNANDNYYASDTYSNGNLSITTDTSKYAPSYSTLGALSGKYYAECKMTSGSSARIGIISRLPQDTGATSSPGNNAYSVGYYSVNGAYYISGSSTSYGNSYTNGDIIGIAMDLDNNRLFFSKNGTWQNSGDPTSSTGAITIPTSYSGFYHFAVSDQHDAENAGFTWNFGNGYFGTTAVSSAGTNASGIGIFEYDVPTGYTALSTKGLNL